MTGERSCCHYNKFLWPDRYADCVPMDKVLELLRSVKYREIADGIFVDRPNRFIAHVGVNGAVETVHVKNTGRCKELLLPGTAVRLEVSDNPKRKTKYDLVAVRKQELGWVNMDSQAPNKVVEEWLSKQEFDLVRPEFAYGKFSS